MTADQPVSIDPANGVALHVADAHSILAYYDVGRLVGFDQLPVRAANAPYYRITTTHGRYFLKRYHQFTPNVDHGLDLITHLRTVGYSAVEVQLTTAGSPHLTHAGFELALFEYLDAPDDRTLTPPRAAALGENLARLHVLAADVPLPKSFAGHDHFSHRLRNLPDWSWLPPAARETLAWVKDLFPTLAPPPHQPRGACHVEFVMEHVRFDGDRLLRIIDWDLVGIDFLFYDLGTTLSEAVHPDRVDFPSLAAIVRAYDSQRPLTTWERDHLYESTCFGRCKFLLWSLGRDTTGPDALPHRSFQIADNLRTLGKTAFDDLLAAAQT